MCCMGHVKACAAWVTYRHVLHGKHSGWAAVWKIRFSGLEQKRYSRSDWRNSKFVVTYLKHGILNEMVRLTLSSALGYTVVWHQPGTTHSLPETVFPLEVDQVHPHNEFIVKSPMQSMFGLKIDKMSSTGHYPYLLISKWRWMGWFMFWYMYDVIWRKNNLTYSF